MSKEKKEKKEEKVVTIRDFKVLIEGMDMVLGDDWVPTEEQWKRIRAKIDAMIETEDRAADRPVDSTRVVADGRLPSNFPVVPSNIPAGAASLPPAPSALTPPPAAPPAIAPGSVPTLESAQVKTPDIDSSKGYSSQFV